MKQFLLKLAVSSAFVWTFAFGIPMALNAMLTVDQGEENVFLADKMGDPPVMVTFQVDPGDRATRPFCIDGWWGGNHQWERPWNKAVVAGAKRGDLLKVHHATYSYRLLGMTFWRSHEDMYWAWPIHRGTRILYPPQTWPLNLDDPQSAYIPFGGGR